MICVFVAAAAVEFILFIHYPQHVVCFGDDVSGAVVSIARFLFTVDHFFF